MRPSLSIDGDMAIGNENTPRLTFDLGVPSGLNAYRIESSELAT